MPWAEIDFKAESRFEELDTGAEIVRLTKVFLSELDIEMLAAGKPVRVRSSVLRGELEVIPDATTEGS